MFGGLALIVVLIVYQFKAQRPLLTVRTMLTSAIPVAGVGVALFAAAASVAATALTAACCWRPTARCTSGCCTCPSSAAPIVMAVVFGFVISRRAMHYLPLVGMALLAAGILVFRLRASRQSATGTGRFGADGPGAGRHRGARAVRCGLLAAVRPACSGCSRSSSCCARWRRSWWRRSSPISPTRCPATWPRARASRCGSASGWRSAVRSSAWRSTLLSGARPQTPDLDEFLDGDNARLVLAAAARAPPIRAAATAPAADRHEPATGRAATPPAGHRPAGAVRVRRVGPRGVRDRAGRSAAARTGAARRWSCASGSPSTSASPRAPTSTSTPTGPARCGWPPRAPRRMAQRSRSGRLRGGQRGGRGGADLEGHRRGSRGARRRPDRARAAPAQRPGRPSPGQRRGRSDGALDHPGDGHSRGALPPLTGSPVRRQLLDSVACVDFELDDEQRAWVDEVRQFLDENVTPALRAEMAEHGLEYQGGELTAFRRKIGEKGWFGLNWPTEYGGLGLGAVHQHLLMTRVRVRGRAGARPDGDVGGADDHAARHRAEQERVPAADRARRDRLRARLLRAQRGHRPGQPAHPRRS